MSEIPLTNIQIATFYCKKPFLSSDQCPKLIVHMIPIKISRTSKCALIQDWFYESCKLLIKSLVVCHTLKKKKKNLNLPISVLYRALSHLVFQLEGMGDNFYYCFLFVCAALCYVFCSSDLYCETFQLRQKRAYV